VQIVYRIVETFYVRLGALADSNADNSKDQSNLAKGGIAPCLYLPGGSSNFQLHALAWV